MTPCQPRHLAPAQCSTCKPRGAQHSARALTLATLMAVVMLPGCAVVSIAGAAAGAAISVTGAVVSTGIQVTGKVVGKAVDVVTPGN